MKVTERYSNALEAKSLSVDVRTTFSPSDVLGAAGMAAHASSEAMILWSVLFQNKTSAKLAAVDMLAKKLTGQMIRNRWKGDPRKIAQEVFAWHMHGTCQPCGGRGYELIPGTPTLSDRLCRQCEGTGKLRLPRGEPYSWLEAYMGALIASAGGKVMQKLAVDMNI
jgi:hypothetical protein